MKTYQSELPRGWFGAAAAAIGVLVVSLAVVVPATIAADRRGPTVAHTTPAATEVAILPSRIEVFATRLPAAVASDDVAPARAPKS